MTDIGPIELSESLAPLFEEVMANDMLNPEIERAKREFFGVVGNVGEIPIEGAAEHRFIEWYLLERYSEVLGGVPARILLPDRDEPIAELFEQSIAGVFVVEAVTKTEIRLRDLQEDSGFDLGTPEGLKAQSGDLLIGRLFSDAATTSIPSVAMALQSAGTELAQALRRDLARLDLGKRLTQAELEHLFFRGRDTSADGIASSVPLEHLEADLERYIREAGGLEWQATEISTALRESPHPTEVVEPLLDEIAFETAADIDQLRTLLIQIWNAHRPDDVLVESIPTASPSLSPEEPLGESLARRIEEGIAGQEDMETVFAELEQALGMEAEDEEGVPRMSEAGEGTTTPFEGDLEPLVGEYLWEEKCDEGPEKATLNSLVSQQRELPLPRMNLESLEATDLLRFLLAAYLASPPDRRCEEVRSRFQILSSFYAWAERTQCYELAPVLKACEDAFVTELDRLHHASHELSEADTPDPGATPSLVRVTDIGPEGVMVMLLGEEPALLIQRDGTEAELQIGDLILGVIEGTDSAEVRIGGFVLVLPESAQGLMG